jgi:hypothetical protein
LCCRRLIKAKKSWLRGRFATSFDERRKERAAKGLLIRGNERMRKIILLLMTR